MAKLFDRVGQATSTTGTGTLTLGSVITDATNGDLLTFADAGAVVGDAVEYLITDGNNFEIGFGTLGGTGPGFTLTRNVKRSKISGTAGTTALTLSGSAKVYCAPGTRNIGNAAPEYISGRFHGALDHYAADQAAPNANYQYFVPIQIFKPCVIDKLVCCITGTGTGNMRMALYDNDPSTSRPGRLLGQTASTTCVGAVYSQISPSSTISIAAPGLYWIGIMLDTAGFNFFVHKSISALSANLTGATDVSNCFNQGQTGVITTASVTYASGFSDPAPTTQFTGGNTPIMIIKVA